MPVSYVDITREELEDWLDSLGHRWSRDSRTAGIYYIHLSDVVAVKLSSTQTESHGSMGYAAGSMKLSLISLVSKQLLNKKDADRSHFKRTLNWRKTWKEGVEHWESVYKQAKGFYDRIAVIEDRSSYKEKLLEKIESVPNWDKNNFLSQLHEKVTNNNILSEAQEAGIDKFVKNVKTRPVPVQESIREQRPEYHHVQPVRQTVVFTPEQQRAMARLEALVEQATPSDKTFTLIMINKAKSGIKLSDEEKQKLIGLLKDYNI